MLCQATLSPRTTLCVRCETCMVGKLTLCMSNTCPRKPGMSVHAGAGLDGMCCIQGCMGICLGGVVNNTRCFLEVCECNG